MTKSVSMQSYYHDDTVQTLPAWQDERSILIGNRIPRDYFVTQGRGESDITIHAGSYHLALKDAGIEMCNIMTYSSILPAVAREVDKPSLVHGSVMETITAVAHTTKGERGTAGIIYGWLHDKRSDRKFGGLVCEHNGAYTPEEINEKLEQSIQELYTNGFSDDFQLKDVRKIIETTVPGKAFGTALVALCFTSYIYPVL